MLVLNFSVMKNQTNILNSALNIDEANMGASANGMSGFPQSCFCSPLKWVCIIRFYLTPVPCKGVTSLRANGHAYFVP